MQHSRDCKICVCMAYLRHPYIESLPTLLCEIIADAYYICAGTSFDTYVHILQMQSMLREETEKLQEDKERLGTDLTALQQQLTSQTQELSTNIDHWEAKVYTFLKSAQ